ncbi:EAL domain-containing protein [Rugamonas apoptosis]|uniref:EAL domain-containing protein n=1 Tax=Rugamonas apoptosis TaxID=2758570 RepID=A0A7W2ILR0_9BURK|nr:EAL domain-containing protein [Rugamonas apoptosis]MBA5689070.1 EAL domain-containing protein [Rugamonas apoptosis]
MRFPILDQYLARLPERGGASTSIWLDEQGRALGRFFNCTMTSAFQPVRALDGGAVRAHEGLARSVAAADEGLSLWKLLDHAASDDESVELDRLCRMLHAINFFRQGGDGDADLYLNVHDRLLSAVSSNHGHAFQRIVEALGLPMARIVLLLPLATERQGWLLNYVADNYRRNGFRIAVQAASAADGLHLLERVRPDVIRLDVRTLGGDAAAEAAAVALLQHGRQAGTAVVFKRLDTAQALRALRRVGDAAGMAPLAQGLLFDAPRARLHAGEAAPRAAAGGALPDTPCAA